MQPMQPMQLLLPPPRQQRQRQRQPQQQQPQPQQPQQQPTSAAERGETEAIECPVCFQSKPPEDVVATTCDHRVCAMCMYKWLQDTCPMCRRPQKQSRK